MSNTARPKFQTTSPGYFSSSDPENPRKEYRAANARPSGHSGGAPAVSTPHRVSSSVRKGERKAKARKSGRA